MLFLYYLARLSALWNVFLNYPPMCKFMGFVTQYSQMSATFWLNAIGFNVWNSFRKFENSSLGGNKLGIFDRRFKWYALYAWGCPMIVTFVTVLMQYLPMTENYFTPGIGKDSCTLHEGRRAWGKFFYFHIINGPILVSHTLLYHNTLEKKCKVV